MIKLSIVIPCYNEADNIPTLVDRYVKIIGTRNDIELILVNDGSKDQSKVILDKEESAHAFLKAIHIYPNGGYGNAVVTGLKVARGEFLCWTHGDLQASPKDVFKALHMIESAENPEDTYVKGLRISRPYADTFFTFGMSMFETFLFGKVLYDINAQPNVFPRIFFTTWNNPPKDFSLDLYVLFLSKKCKMKVLRFPVNFEKRMHGVSSWNVDWKSKIKFIKRTVMFSVVLRFRD